MDHFTSGSSSGHSSSDHSLFGHSISGYSLSRHASPDTIVADSSTPPGFVHPPLTRTPWCSEAYLRWRSASLSTMYPPTTSDLSAGDSSFESSAGPSRKRCRDSISLEDSIEEDIDTDVLEDIEANATAIEVVVDRDVVTGIDAGIDMEVDVEVESSDRGTMEVGVDVTARIDIPDGILMPDVVERLKQLESRSLIAGGEKTSLLDQVASLERINARLRGTMMMERARADRFRRRNMTITRSGITPEAIKELVNRRVEEALAAYEVTHAANALEAKNGNGGNGNGGNRNPNENNRGARPVARECTYQDFMKCQPLNFKGTEGVVGLIRELMKLMAKVYCPRTKIQKIESKLWNLTVKNNDLAAYTQRFQELTMMYTKMVLEEEDRVEKFIGGLPDNIGNLKDQNLGNKTGNKNSVGEARGKAYVLGGGDANPDSNVVTGHPFNIDLMPVELGSFDVIIGMDWLANHHAVIVCDENIVRIPYGDKVLIIQGDKSDKRKKSKLNIISCTKTQKYIKKGCLIFLAKITKKETEDKSEEKRLEDVPIVRYFPEVI
ncbi:putative reverse transcriptase domain-containing protein [Tanacetum coccineum]